MKHQISLNEVNVILDEFNESAKREMAEKLLKHTEQPAGHHYTPEEWREVLHKKCAELLDDKVIRKDYTKAFEIIENHLSRHLSKIEYAEIQNEWKNAVFVLNNYLDPQKENQEDVDPTKQFNEICGISEKTLEHFYEVGLRCYNEKMFSDAEAIFRLLASLNTCKENVWISLGLCQRQLSNPMMGVYCFAMAIIMNSRNVLSYIHSAECYLMLNEHVEAKECLISAQELAEEEKGERRQALKDFIKKLLKEC